MSAILATTPSQTAGPFFACALPWNGGARLYDDATLGERIAIAGTIFDGDRLPVTDALVEIWQANAAGRYAHDADSNVSRARDPAFLGFGRCPTDANGTYAFETIRPGRVAGPGGALQAPHIVVGIFARGLLKRLVTRIYFPDAAENADDAILNLVDPARRERLIAERAEPIATDACAHYRFDLVLQGAGESVFFAC